MLCFVYLFFFIVSTSVIDFLERLVSEMTCYVSIGTFKPHTLTHPMAHPDPTCASGGDAVGRRLLDGVCYRYVLSVKISQHL